MPRPQNSSPRTPPLPHGIHRPHSYVEESVPEVAAEAKKIETTINSQYVHAYLDCSNVDAICRKGRKEEEAAVSSQFADGEQNPTKTTLTWTNPCRRAPQIEEPINFQCVHDIKMPTA